MFGIFASLSEDKQGHQKRSPLHIAAFHGHIEIVKALLASGADQESKNKFGETPLDEAIDGKQQAVEGWGCQDGSFGCLSLVWA